MKLTVCIPVYNVAPYIERCARSLFGQSYRDIEYIFVDDCTPDDSVAIVDQTLKDFPDRAGQVRILRHDRNRGLIAARKTAIRAATGDFVIQCDSDDWVDADLYEKMMSRQRETDADAVLCPLKSYAGERTIVSRPPEGLDLPGLEAMRRMGEIPGLNSTCTKIIRRICVDLDEIEWPDDICICEDYCLTMQILPSCRRVVSVADSFYHYRINSNSMTRSRDVQRLIDHHSRVYDILTRKVPGTEGIPARRNLIRPILFWGVVSGLLSKLDFVRWRTSYEELGGVWCWKDMSLWGQRMMRLADCSLALSHLVAPFVRHRVNDYL